MGLFSLTKEIAIDLGTANTIILHNDKIVIDEPSIVAIDKTTQKLKAVGKEAQQMRGRENPNITTIRPLRQGVIADFNAAELMIRGLVKNRAATADGSPPRCAWSWAYPRDRPKWRYAPCATPASMPAAAMST